MTATTTQQRRLLAVKIGTLDDDLLLLDGFSGQETMSSLFCFHLRMVSERPDKVLPELILGQPTCLALELRDGTHRHFHGHVNRFSRGERGARFTEYYAQVVPWLWFLTLTWDCRIYQDLSVPDIVRQVFRDNGFVDFRDVLTAEHIKRDYCVQYRETDFNFLSRLMEEEGIWYYFEHAKGKHTLVFTDTLQAHQACPNQAQFHFRPENGTGVREDTITFWETTREVRSDRYTLRDYHFEMPEKSLEFTRRSVKNGNGNGQARWEIFDYPGDYALRFNKPGKRLDRLVAEGEKVIGLSLEEEETPQVEIQGSSLCRVFDPGFTFGFLNPPPAAVKGPYLLTSVQHSASQGSAFASGARAEGSYFNTFTCLPPGAKFRPVRATTKPVVAGPQTAVVVGNKDKEIDVDPFGRVKVQFHWDRQGKKDENSSGWIRVAQIWAGKRWGASFWPRIGQEVVVEFLEGDADKPIIVGSVYNAEQMPPYLGEGPDAKHRHDPNVSGVKTCSTPGGNGFNEIRFDDTKGKEQLFLRAENTMDVHVNGSAQTSVGGNNNLTVDGSNVQLVKEDQGTQVNGELTVNANGKIQLASGGDFLVGGQCINLSGDLVISLKAGQAVFIKGDIGIGLVAGSSFINIMPDGIWINGPEVHINSGGKAMQTPKYDYVPAASPAGADDAVTGFPSAPGAKIAPPRPQPSKPPASQPVPTTGDA